MEESSLELTFGLPVEGDPVGEIRVDWARLLGAMADFIEQNTDASREESLRAATGATLYAREHLQDGLRQWLTAFCLFDGVLRTPNDWLDAVRAPSGEALLGLPAIQERVHLLRRVGTEQERKALANAALGYSGKGRPRSHRNDAMIRKFFGVTRERLKSAQAAIETAIKEGEPLPSAWLRYTAKHPGVAMRIEATGLHQEWFSPSATPLKLEAMTLTLLAREHPGWGEQEIQRIARSKSDRESAEPHAKDLPLSELKRLLRK